MLGIKTVSAILALAAALAVTAWPQLAMAQSASEARPSICLAIAERQDGLPIIPASFTRVQAQLPEVAIRYVTHSSFRIESPEGVTIVTDYAGVSGSGLTPEVATMNHTHQSHYTDYPEPGIAHVLQGWGPEGGKIDHYLQIGDVLIRNVSTDIMRSGVLIEKSGNSIFIFEVAGLCIGHVGHLHHKLTPEHIAAIGRLDIVMIPVDGSVTMSVEGMSELAQQLRSSVVLPMHWFSTYSLDRFVSKIGATFHVRMAETSEIRFDLKNLPDTPTVIILQPEEGDFFAVD